MGSSEDRLIAAARRGDEHAFRELTGPWVEELRAHCTRLLGNRHDAEDAVQETLVKAWKKLGTFRARGPLRAWLYTIATNTSLNLMKAGRRHTVAQFAESEPDPTGPGLDVGYELREELEMAFLATVHRLPARQRAVVILRDGLGWSPAEVAELLGDSVASVNSALQRARAALASPPASPAPDPRLDDLHQALLSGYVAAWDETDVDRLVSLARVDATRTTLLQRLEPLGGGWVRVPDDTTDQSDLSFRPAFTRC